MTLYVSSITIDQVIDYLADFLTPIVSPAEIVRAQVNRVPMPSDPCVVLTELLQSDLNVPYLDYQPSDDTGTVHQSTRIDIQIDFYGSQAGDFCKAVKSVFRSSWAFDKFPDNVRPLYTSDGIQSPLVTGEEQYESRWTLTVSLQYNPTVSVPQDFADELSATVYVPADLQ